MIRNLVRVIVGALFFGHGTQKLFGWFGGHGPEGTGQYFENLGLKPGKHNALAAGGAEAIGGVLFGLGFLTPLGAAMMSGSMLTAIRTVHLEKGPWVTEGGYEYNLVLLGAAYAFTEEGPGRLSLDNGIFGRDRWGTPWAIAELVTGAIASELTIRSGRQQAQQQAGPQAATPDGAGAEREQAVPTGS
ncbi:MAG TPA: DoxX family protein [Thermoleophilaceae bacterium]